MRFFAATENSRRAAGAVASNEHEDLAQHEGHEGDVGHHKQFRRMGDER